jgi:Domain of unknown function (DUF1737)
MITLYSIITNSDIDELTDSVQHVLFDGWTPCGGLTVMGDQYVQAVIKHVTEKEYAVMTEGQE